MIVVQALKLLAVMSAMRLDDKQDKIESALKSSLLDGGPVSQNRSVTSSSTDPLASSTWEEVAFCYSTTFFALQMSGRELSKHIYIHGLFRSLQVIH